MTAETINTSTDALIPDGVLKIATCLQLSAYMGRKEAPADAKWPASYYPTRA